MAKYEEKVKKELEKKDINIVNVDLRCIVKVY